MFYSARCAAASITMLYLISLFKGDKGLGLGSQISQICALSYVNAVDHYIKEKLRIKYYGRYMDDFYLIHNDKDYLYRCLKEITAELKKLGLEVNKRTRIHKLSNGFIFTKIRYILTDSGKVLHLITTKTFKSMKRKIKKGVEIKDILPSWYAYLNKFNCYNKKKEFIKKFIKR